MGEDLEVQVLHSDETFDFLEYERCNTYIYQDWGQLLIMRHGTWSSFGKTAGVEQVLSTCQH